MQNLPCPVSRVLFTAPSFWSTLSIDLQILSVSEEFLGRIFYTGCFQLSVYLLLNVQCLFIVVLYDCNKQL